MSTQLSTINADEWRDLQETGRWEAYDAEDNSIASGELDPLAGESLGGSNYKFEISPGKEIARLQISATAYANGIGTDRPNKL